LISSLKINRFRGIRNCKIDNLKDINVFIGRNNSGKSSILEALYLASAAFNFNEPLGRKDNKIEYLLNRRCERGLNWVANKEILWYGYETGKPIEIELGLIKRRGKIKINVFDWHKHPMLMEDSFLIKHYLRLDGDSICLIDWSIAKTYAKSFTNINSRTITSVLNKMHRWKFEDVKGFMKDFVLVDTNLIYHMENVEKALWNNLLKKRLDKLVTQVLRKGYEIDVEDITYVPYGSVYQLAVKLPETTIRVDDLGDGARYSVVLIMIAALARNSALLIEEPENHQHPTGLAKTLEMLLDLVKQNKIQIFISTHSVEFLDLLEKMAEERELELAFFFLERDKKGNIESRYITSKDKAILTKMGFDVRFLDII